jgi:hypothetical protein
MTSFYSHTVGVNQRGRCAVTVYYMAKQFDIRAAIPFTCVHTVLRIRIDESSVHLLPIFQVA